MSLTLEDIAQLAGVSRATVSRVVNNYPFVRPEVRERVQRIVREHNYSPFPAAKVAPQHTRNIGLFFSAAARAFFGDEFSLTLTRGIAQECESRGYFASAILADGVTDARGVFRRALASRACDGFIGVVCSAFDPLLPQLIQSAAPAVLIGQHPRFAELPSVPLNEFEAARAATARLLGRGRVGFISAPLGLIPAQNSLAGYKAALKDAKIAYDAGLVVEVEVEVEVEIDASGEDWQQTMRHFYNAGASGALAASPSLAAAAARALREGHPQNQLELATPALPPAQEVGRAAVQMVLERALSA